MYSDFNSFYADFKSFCLKDKEFIETQNLEKGINSLIKEIPSKTRIDYPDYDTLLRKAVEELQRKEFNKRLEPILRKKSKIEKKLRFKFFNGIAHYSQEELSLLTESIRPPKRRIVHIPYEEFVYEEFVYSYRKWVKSKGAFNRNQNRVKIIFFCFVLTVILLVAVKLLS